ncbi:hypothetical protein AMTRI_Chr05g71910 [Amborella trichopoda]|uniref:Uncharacterized protein n=1 Tax=Amborella trichopoda TaxID=13333 RepID=W1NT31_AMBTC|nr:hypothetical protein AMTR_s00104p00145950 [Amborella trichopoda]
MAENPNETQTNPDQENDRVATSLSPPFSPSILPPSSTSPLLNIVATGLPHVAAHHTIISLKDTMAMVDDEDTLKRRVENARAITIGLFTASFPSAGLSWLIKNQKQKAAFLLLLFGCILLSGQALGLIIYGLCKNETFHLVEYRMYFSIVLFFVAFIIFICSQVSMVAVAPVVVALLVITVVAAFLGY